jgi:hypothetical protein
MGGRGTRHFHRRRAFASTSTRTRRGFGFVTSLELIHCSSLLRTRIALPVPIRTGSNEQTSPRVCPSTHPSANRSINLGGVSSRSVYEGCWSQCLRATRSFFFCSFFLLFFLSVVCCALFDAGRFVCPAVVLSGLWVRELG